MAKIIIGIHGLSNKPEEKNYHDEKPEIVTALRARYDAWAKDVFDGKVPE